MQVALGGAIGAALRHVVGAVIARAGVGAFPLGVLTVNVIGSFLMGVFISAAAQRGLTPWSPFVATGILGGFTTFSAFSLETVTLWERGDQAQAVLYIGVSVVLSVAALVLGTWAARTAMA